MAREESFFDELARGLADGSVTRGKALRLMGGALVGAALASVPGVAWANDRCPEGQSRCNDRCVNLQRSERHCGSCRNRCGSEQTCCGGRCVNLKRSERHCGSCSNSCAEGQECVDGVCSGGEPICTPPCPFPCGCFDRADGTGTVCVDCGNTECQQVSSCAECTDPQTVCFIDFTFGGAITCGSPCQPCQSNGRFCRQSADCCSGNCVNGTCACPSGTVTLSNGTCAKPCAGPADCPGCAVACNAANSGNFCVSGVGSQTPCTTDSQCPQGELCLGSACVAACS
jgi:Stigma-specific protein, Stig1